MVDAVAPMQPVLNTTDRVIVISLMKSGTHLIQELMVALGYGMYGQSRITSEIRPNFTSEARRKIARMVYDDDHLAIIEALENNDPRFIAETDRAWDALGWSWQLRFGMPLANRYGEALVNADLVTTALRRTRELNFSQTPSGICWILPEFDIKKIDGRFLAEWATTGEPRIIFNYRDPRDMIVSMVNFLCGKTANGIGNFSEFLAFSKILKATPSLEGQLTYALTDPSFPGSGDLERSLWLLHHPDVCKVSFEELVGERGGGSQERQQAAKNRIARFLNANEAAADARELFREDSFSFYAGQIGSWRQVFTKKHEGLFAERFGSMLSAYGYA